MDETQTNSSDGADVADVTSQPAIDETSDVAPVDSPIDTSTLTVEERLERIESLLNLI